MAGGKLGFACPSLVVGMAPGGSSVQGCLRLRPLPSFDRQQPPALPGQPVDA
jgi:hypothetical protein